VTVKNCGVFEDPDRRVSGESGDKFLVVSTSSTTDSLPEPVEGSSGDFDLLPSLMGEGSGVGLLVVAKERTYKVNICYLV
jgi:hypothetical protein